MIFVAKNIMASRVNLIMNDYAAGLPSPLAFLGLADSLVRSLDLKPWSGRVIPILHEVTPSEGRTKPEMEKKGSKFGPIEMIEDMHGRVRVSLVLDLPGCTDEQDLKSALQGKRIAGGIVSTRDIKVETAAEDGAAFRALPRGYAMIRPETPERLRVSRGDTESLAHIAEQLFPVEKPKGFGWIVPCAAGYRHLENPATAPERKGTRDATIPHIFVEPLVGIAELISVRNPRLQDAKPTQFDDLFWSWSATDELILGHSAYTLT